MKAFIKETVILWLSENKRKNKTHFNTNAIQRKG